MHYREQNSTLTLAQGLEEYYHCNPTFQNFDGFMGMPNDVVRAHDIAHVVFGCGSTSADELVVETWTLFGCKVPPRKYAKAIGDGFIGQVTHTFGVYRLLRRLLLSLPRVLRALWAALRAKKRWPHFEYDGYLDRPLREIRTEFGIRVV